MQQAGNMENLLTNEADVAFMKEAIALAHKAEEKGEVPIGAVVVYQNRIIASAYNTRECEENPAGHAEFLALQEASRVLGRWRLSGCTVYVTLEPCLMCAGMMINARVDECIFGAYDPKAGALSSLYEVHQDERLNHTFSVRGGVCKDECAQMLTSFFRKKRQFNKQAKREGVASEKQKVLAETELECYRKEIDYLDDELKRLYVRRLEVSALVADYKRKNGLKVFDATREQVKLDRVVQDVSPEFASYVTRALQFMMDESKKRQQELLEH